jgi:hypothetical protein
VPDDDPQLTTKAEAAISKKDVEVARRKAEIAAIERQANILGTNTSNSPLRSCWEWRR